MNGALIRLLAMLENGDPAPTEPMQHAYVADCADLKTAVTTWGTINGTALAAFNAVLTKNNGSPWPWLHGRLAVAACTPTGRVASALPTQ